VCAATSKEDWEEILAYVNEHSWATQKPIAGSSASHTQLKLPTDGTTDRFGVSRRYKNVLSKAWIL
jgi:hypothetical protein